MANKKRPEDLDSIFEALANKHRREIVYALGFMPHSISQLAVMRNLSLPAIHKHIKILISANLIQAKKIGRTNVLALRKETIQKLQRWLIEYQTYWGNGTDSLENYTQYVSEKNPKKGGETK